MRGTESKKAENRALGEPVEPYREERDLAALELRSLEEKIGRISQALTTVRERSMRLEEKLEEALPEPQDRASAVPRRSRLASEVIRLRRHVRELEKHARHLESEIRRSEEALDEAKAFFAERAIEDREATEERARTVAYVRKLEGRIGKEVAQREELSAYTRSLESAIADFEAQQLHVSEYVRTVEKDRDLALALGYRSVHAVTVHHRGSDLLDGCIRSLLDTGGVRVEVIVVANACVEPLPAIVASHPRVHLVRSDEAIGFSAANNLGVRWGRSHLPAPDYYFFVNNDALTEPSALRGLVESLEACPSCGIAGPRLVIWGAEDHLNSLGLNVTRVGEAWDEGIGLAAADYGALPPESSVLAVTGSALMIRSSLLEEVGGWTELYGYYDEDIDLCLKARSRGWDVRLVPEAVVRHAISATSGQGSDFKTLLSWRNQFLLIFIHWPISLLLRVGPKLVWTQLGVWIKRHRVKAHADARLQARSWLGALRLLPRALLERWRSGAESGWISMLRPPGTVPQIELPEVDLGSIERKVT